MHTKYSNKDRVSVILTTENTVNPRVWGDSRRKQVVGDLKLIICPLKASHTHTHTHKPSSYQMSCCADTGNADYIQRHSGKSSVNFNEPDESPAPDL